MKRIKEKERMKMERKNGKKRERKTEKRTKVIMKKRWE